MKLLEKNLKGLKDKVCDSLRITSLRIGHFTVVCLVTWPVTASEAGGDLALIQTSPLFLCK